MSLFNEIQVGRFNRYLQKLLAIKGAVPAPQVASEYVPVIPYQQGVEVAYLQSIDRFATFISIAGAVAGLAAIRFRNPQTSNVIAVFESFVIMTSLTDQPLLSGQAIATDLAGIFTPGAARLDPRGRANPSLILSSVNAGANLTQNRTFLGLLATSSQELIQHPDQEIPLLPGDAIQWTAQTPNLTLLIGATWRERFLEDSERT